MEVLPGVLVLLQGGKLGPLEKKMLEHMRDYIQDMKRDLQTGMSLKDLTLQIFKLVDEAMQVRVDWKKITCKAGCNHCCRINVGVTEVEAEILIDYAEKHKIKINKEALERQQHLNDKQRTSSKFADCVFLSKEGLCKVYEVRPIVCRKYLVQTDPKLCNAQRYNKGGVGVNIELETELLINAFASLSTNMKSGHMAAMMIAAQKRRNVAVSPQNEVAKPL